jgi:DNA-binding CsgD family transcriptional regulator
MGTSTLTRREREVLELLSAGNPPKKAASLLGIERQSVINRLFSAKARMGARTSFQLIAMFARDKVKDEI